MKILAVCLAVVLVVLLCLSAYMPTFLEMVAEKQLSTYPTETVEPTETSVPTEPTAPTETSTPTQVTEPTVVTEPTQVTEPPETTPESLRYVISFGGDCTFADKLNATASSLLFTSVVGDRFDYPLAGVKPFFEADDLTILNLECALTTYDPTDEEMSFYALHNKEFRFRGDPKYVNILTSGSVEVASLANNHCRDFAMPGLNETKSVLKNAGVRYASWSDNCLVTTQSGLVVGIYANNSGATQADIKNNVKKLRDQGAEIVVVSLHWGDERHYAPNEKQQTLGRYAIDVGADIVFGHHPHVLQPIEFYNGGVIMYSMGNFSFGGNKNPADKDTVVVQQEILRAEDGTVSLGDTLMIPCRISSVANRNDYQPTPYAPNDPGYARVLSKLDGSYAQQWLAEQQATAPTEITEPTT